MSRSARSAGVSKPFLRDAFEQLDATLRRTAASDAAPEEVRAARQQIQRWLVVFAREHLTDICDKLMETAAEHAPAATAGEAAKIKLPQKKLPQKADGPTTSAQQRDDSVAFFLLETLRRVLSAAAERGSLQSLRSRDGGLLPFCYDHLSLAKPVAIRHVAGLCVGVLSRSQLKASAELFAAGLDAVHSDREQACTRAHRHSPQTRPKARSVGGAACVCTALRCCRRCSCGLACAATARQHQPPAHRHRQCTGTGREHGRAPAAAPPS
jgi:hypothetical protein